ncbi:MAG TPA: LytTR family DNA-binding domain-containing protein [Rhodothermales bacterium]|nr:LytTR family DNA-binding domain-containing protein [Rhodothermales bacterium]
MSAPIRVLIVDDEPLARARLRALVEAEPGAFVAGVCEDGVEAVEALRRGGLDLVFLDVEMPGLDGFGVVEEVGPEAMPTVVFVTAYDAFALRAFEAHALDYVLKPFDDARFAAAFARARTRIQERRLGHAAEQLQALLAGAREPADAPFAPATPGSPELPLERIGVRVGDRVLLVPASDVDYIEADGPYAILHVDDRRYVVRMSLTELTARLDPRWFARIHRSTIVNLSRVRELREYTRGEWLVKLHDGTELNLSRSRRLQLAALLGHDF